MFKENPVIINLPDFDFENPHSNTIATKSLFEKIQRFLDAKGVNRNEYGLDGQITAGLGELIMQQINGFWLVFTTERGTNFDIAIFSNEFHAVNYFTFRLTGEKDTIEWSTI